MLRTRADGWRHFEEAKPGRSEDGGYFPCLNAGTSCSIRSREAHLTEFLKPKRIERVRQVNLRNKSGLISFA